RRWKIVAQCVKNQDFHDGPIPVFGARRLLHKDRGPSPLECSSSASLRATSRALAPASCSREATSTADAPPPKTTTSLPLNAVRSACSELCETNFRGNPSIDDGT